MYDFRSDTLTKPTDEMREAMARAKVGDDVFGEDPTVVDLEREAAATLGKEAALFVPSGTMANQIALHLHCRPGDDVICDARSHIALFEAGGAARWSGVTLRGLESEDGFPSPDAIRAAISPDDVHLTRTSLLALENTHNMAGGVVMGEAGIAARCAVAREAGLAVHVDGARLWNAAVAAGCEPRDLVAAVDSVSVCLSKGLGAPIGSVLAGTAAWIQDARRVRKALGGGMRQVGVIAAAAKLAWRDARATVSVDHERAARLARGLAGVTGIEVATPDSNIVMMSTVGTEASALVDFMADRSVYALAVGADRIRFVLHRDLVDAAVDACVDAVQAWSRSSQLSNP